MALPKLTNTHTHTPWSLPSRPQVYFVKCLKINAVREPENFDNDIVGKQLTSSGIIDVCNFQVSFI